MNRDNILIEADELLKKLENKNIRIFDATITDDVYLQGHIPGAVYFDHEKFSDLNSPYSCTILPEAELSAAIGNAGISNDSEVVVYACGMLPYAVRAWWVLRYAGHNNVRVLNGGLTAWKNAGGMVEQVTRQYGPAVFKAQFRPEMFASKEEILESMQNNDVAIVDVLPLVSYEASHIPDSICLPCMDLMQGDLKQGFDYLLPNDALALRLGDVSKHKRIITYCGGGIAAAVNAAAHLMTGHENVAVYDGSLYEWLGEGLPTNGTGKWEVWM
ncbi:MAG TPA: rhodanese-like domain-containing protein [Anaerolineales bacterium]|nr:rhodanese-like domain-containing protein [Anaerolineales bacterium]